MTQAAAFQGTISQNLRLATSLEGRFFVGSRSNSTPLIYFCLIFLNQGVLEFLPKYNLLFLTGGSSGGNPAKFPPLSD